VYNGPFSPGPCLTGAVDAETTPVLRGERVILRPLEEADIPRLAAILREEEVARWWGDYGEERARAEILSDPGWAIEVDCAAAGWLAASEEEEPDYRHVAFDIFLATEVHGRGLGREALSLAVRHFAALGHHRFTIDPAVTNERAIRSYAAVGFRPVGVMRAYERGRDGAWHDNLLMDLLARELEPPPGPPARP
jgi:aminoglycoside 6'-N-acetyltransferase